MAKADSPAAPQRIGKYEIVKLLGKGAMGAVYQAHDPVLDRDVALKVMLPQIADDPEQKQRFEREARAVARMMHPNVVTVFDLGYHTDGSPYIVMERLRGRDLLETLRLGPPLSLEVKISIVLQALDGLGHAHKVGIVHRDIKPANLFISEEGATKIMDFGVARLTSTSATASGVIFGTANYMSPEQVLGGPLDGRSDLFSVGCMLCELVSGRRPFVADTVMSTLYKITHDAPVFEIPALAPYAGLLPVLQRSLAKKADERFSSAAEFASALREFVKGVAAVAQPTTHAVPPPAVLPLRPLDTTQGLKVAPSVASTVGVARPPADPSKLFRLLREVYVGSKSGHLHLTHGSELRSLRILRGHILQGSCDVAGHHLGDVAVRFGLLSQADLERAVTVVLRDRRRLGSVLAELRLLDRERLEEALGIHVREILFSVVDRSGGSYAFEEVAEADLETDVASKLSTGELILEATRRVQDPGLVRHVLGDLDRILELSTDPLLRSQKITLTAADGFILSRVDGTLTAREVIGLIPLPHEDTERSLFGLLCTGTVGHRPEPTRTRPVLPPPRKSQGPDVLAASLPRAAARPALAVPPPAAAEPPQESRAPVPRQALDIRQTILEAHDGLQGKDHFEVLGIPITATEAEVRSAHSRLILRLHPDACPELPLSDIREQRAAVFLRVREAYETLRDPERRLTYERERVRRNRPRAGANAPQAPTLVPPSSKAPSAAPVSPPSPPPEQKTFEPQGGDSEMDAQEVAEGIRRAEALLKDEQPWDAIQKLEKVMPHARGPLRTRARVALARAFMKNPKWAKRADDVLQSVISESPDCAEAYAALGTIYRAGQLWQRSVAMYRKALELSPSHAEAQEGLAALDSPRSSSAPHSLARTLFGKLSRDRGDRGVAG